ncbi:hypothetical protein FFLO_05933 [Filobasidium floriforme]|uniref:Chitin synthase n=1 Tax=Filobasidium floriforme TaxID=5210 RepID=A0A8K0NQY3_9TREE|nr:hypothetical protein FFLO_05933 [Filobasidium floriforme]
MRYSAVTCDPDDFTKANGWSLRTSDYGRETELLIAVTSYNEDKILYARTLHALMLNIRDICNTKVSKFWRTQAEEGRPPWQRITVALIADGLGPMDKGTLDLLATVGCYQDAVIKKEVGDKRTVAHIFEANPVELQYTTQISVDSKPQLVHPYPGDPNNLVPVQIIFVLKQENEKKINSHRWLFNAIGRMLKPEVCVLIDAGTKPGHKAIYHLWEAFYNDPHLGGACGEITTMIKKGKKLVNPLVAAQNFEYKMSNILDKPLESTFGYVSVLPGAFSAYRFKAIQGKPLEEYFRGDHSLADRLGPDGINGMGIFKKNMFLAEDRILCFELAAKAGERWTLGYVKPSKAETDVPEQASELISQRRRWLNGSIAASVYALYHFFRIYRSKHGPLRMLLLHIQAVVCSASLFLSFFGLANMYITFAIIIDLLPASTGIYLFHNAAITHWVNTACVWLYLATLGLQVVLGLGNRPKGEKKLYLASLVVFGIMSIYTLVCAVILAVKAIQGIFDGGNALEGFKKLLTTPEGLLVVAGLSIFFFYFSSSLLFRDPWHLLSSMPQYLVVAPSFVNVLNVYAFCNLHDVSWGTKGSDKMEALPSLKVEKEAGGEVVVKDIQRDQDELDDAFKLVVSRCVQPLPKDKSREKPSVDDQNKTFRTRTLVVWLVSNAALAIAIITSSGFDQTHDQAKDCFGDKATDDPSNADANCAQRALTAFLNEDKETQDKTKYYFTALLYATAGITLVKFLGCLIFWLRRQTGRFWRRN